MIGTKRISEAAGDGLTLGLVNAAGLMASRLLGDENVPDLGRDLTAIATLTTGDASGWSGPMARSARSTICSALPRSARS